MWLIQYLSRLPEGRRHAIHAYAFYVMHFLRHTFISSFAYEDVLQSMKQIMDLDHSQSGETESFLDLASLFRELHGALQSPTSAARMVCRFPETSMAIAEFLQQKAQEEVRTKVISTAGSVLLAELAEQIVEYALLAEGLSVEFKTRFVENRPTRESAETLALRAFYNFFGTSAWGPHKTHCTDKVFQ